MEPNTNEATAPKRLKTGGKKPIIIIGVIVAVLLAAYVGLCAYANSLDIFYPNTTINGVDVAGLTAEQAAERLRQEIPEETVEFYLPLAPIGSWASQRNWTMRSVPNPHLMPCRAGAAFLSRAGSILPAWSEQMDNWASCWSRRRISSR